MTRAENVRKALEVAKIVAARYCRRYGIFPGLKEEIEQEAALIALEKLEELQDDAGRRMNWIARAVSCRLIDLYRRDRRRHGKEIVESDITPAAEESAGVLSTLFVGASDDPARILEREEEKAKVWETFDATLAHFNEIEQEIINRRVIVNERVGAITAATGAGRKRIAAVVAEFAARFKELWKDNNDGR